MEMKKPEISIDKLQEKIKASARELGVRSIYTILLLFYAYKENDTPSWARGIVIGALAYFVNPFDSIPDLTPLVGYSDDIGILGFALVTISGYINMNVKINARKKVKAWFKEIDLKVLKKIEDRIS